MIVRKVGEERAIERDAVHAALNQAVGGDFHDGTGRALIPETRQQRMNLQRVRRRVRGLDKRARKARAERAHDPRLRAQGGGEPLRARRLAVGAGDAAHPERVRRPAVELVREESRPLAQPADGAVRRPPLGAPGKAFGFPDHRGRAALDRLRDVAAPVAALSRPGEKAHAGRAAAAVRGEALDHRPLARELFEQVQSRPRVTCSPSLPRPRRAARSARAAHRAAR